MGKWREVTNIENIEWEVVISTTHHLKKCEIRCKNMIEVNFRYFPRVVAVGVCEAVVFVVDYIYANKFTGRVDARLEPTAEQIDTHDAENEPEDQTYKQYVENGGNRLN